MTEPLTRAEATIIRLLDAGYTRRRIAYLSVLAEDTVRDIIADLCQRYDCTQTELPAEAAADNETRTQYRPT